jgi:anti-sigma regulatory factor (Ser/Thr protein kinase)
MAAAILHKLAQVDLAKEPGPGDLRVLGFHEYLPQAGDVAEARHFVRQALEADGADPDFIGAAELIVDEFALNAVTHAHSFFSVLVERGDSAVRVGVRDDSDVIPKIPDHLTTSLHGRGLTIVAKTAEEWGTEPLGRGKEVWALLRRA